MFFSKVTATLLLASSALASPVDTFTVVKRGSSDWNTPTPCKGSGSECVPQLSPQGYLGCVDVTGMPGSLSDNCRQACESYPDANCNSYNCYTVHKKGGNNKDMCAMYSQPCDYNQCDNPWYPGQVITGPPASGGPWMSGSKVCNRKAPLPVKPKPTKPGKCQVNGVPVTIDLDQDLELLTIL